MATALIDVARTEPELLAEIIAYVDEPLELSGALRVSRAFREAGARALELRCARRGEALPTSLGAGAASLAHELLLREAVRAGATRCSSVVGLGVDFSAFVDACGALLTCGGLTFSGASQEDENWGGYAHEREVAPLLGHGMQPAHARRFACVLAPRPIASLLHARVRIARVACGGYHTLALGADGAVYSHGHAGALGHPDGADRHSPRRIEALAGVRAVGLAAGGASSAVICCAGGVYTFGAGADGQLGHGEREEQKIPRKVAALGAERIVGAALGEGHSLFVGVDGRVHSCGRGRFGVLGHGDVRARLTPEPIGGPLAAERALCAAASYEHSVLVCASGVAYAFGRRAPALGLGMEYCRQPGVQSVPAPITAVEPSGAPPPRFVRVAAAISHTLLLDSEGRVHSFGRDQAGVLGHGQLRSGVFGGGDVAMPRQIEWLCDDADGPRAPRIPASTARVVAIAAGGLSTSCLVCDDRSAYTFGDAMSGSLGHGKPVSAARVDVPTRVARLPPMLLAAQPSPPPNPAWHARSPSSSLASESPGPTRPGLALEPGAEPQPRGGGADPDSRHESR